jgi:hypothetical protein
MATRGQPTALDHLYQHRRWRQIRRLQLQQYPLCRLCEWRGLVTPATICDHAQPHSGDVGRFWTGPFVSLCKSCHDGAKRRLELGRRVIFFGLDGLPILELEPSAEAVRQAREREARAQAFRWRARGRRLRLSEIPSHLAVPATRKGGS